MLESIFIDVDPEASTKEADVADSIVGMFVANFFGSILWPDSRVISISQFQTIDGAPRLLIRTITTTTVSFTRLVWPGGAHSTLSIYPVKSGPAGTESWPTGAATWTVIGGVNRIAPKNTAAQQYTKNMKEMVCHRVGVHPKTFENPSVV